MKEDPIEYGIVIDEDGAYIDEIDKILLGSQPTCPTLEEPLRIEKYKIEFVSEPPIGVQLITWACNAHAP